LGGVKCRIQKRISLPPFRSIMGAVVEFNGDDDLGGIWVAKHEVEMMAGDHVAVAGGPGGGGTVEYIGNADLDGDQVFAADGRLKRAKECEFAATEERAAPVVRQSRCGELPGGARSGRFCFRCASVHVVVNVIMPSLVISFPSAKMPAPFSAG
jgi:hypothetical protein